MKNEIVDSQQSAVGSQSSDNPVLGTVTLGFNQRPLKLKAIVRLFQSQAIGKLVMLMVWLMAAPSFLTAQTDSTQPHTVDMATTMRSNGKIYVVVAVLVIILLGLFFYLIRLDRKIGKLEKE